MQWSDPCLQIERAKPTGEAFTVAFCLQIRVLFTLWFNCSENQELWGGEGKGSNFYLVTSE